MLEKHIIIIIIGLICFLLEQDLSFFLTRKLCLHIWFDFDDKEKKNCFLDTD